MLDVLETFLYGSRDQKTHQPPAYEASAALAAGRPRVRGSATESKALPIVARRARSSVQARP